jgi:hypothetical protein
MNVVSSSHPAAQERLAVGRQPVQLKPSRAPWRWCNRVYGDDFKKHRFAKWQKQVVRAHSRVLATLLWVNTQKLMYPFTTGR